MPDDHPEYDPLPALMAGIDQGLMLVPHLARLARAYFDGFIEEGFSEAQALHLTGIQLVQPDFEAPE